jgi:hypothetical protein
MRLLRTLVLSALLFGATSSAVFAGDGGGYAVPSRGDDGGYSAPGDSQPVRGDGGGYALPSDNQPVQGDGGGYSTPTGPAGPSDQHDYERWA